MTSPEISPLQQLRVEAQRLGDKLAGFDTFIDDKLTEL